jgi:hypothetical protein
VRLGNAALLLVDAVSEWSPSPLLLGVTFGAAPNGPCAVLDEGR